MRENTNREETNHLNKQYIPMIQIIRASKTQTKNKQKEKRKKIKTERKKREGLATVHDCTREGGRVH